MLITLAVIALVMALLAYSSWTTYTAMTAKSKAVYWEEQHKVTLNVLFAEQKARITERDSYEARLTAKQTEIDTLKAYMLRSGKSLFADVITSMSQGEEITTDGND